MTIIYAIVTLLVLPLVGGLVFSGFLFLYFVYTLYKNDKEQS